MLPGVARREQFFEFSWWYFIMLVAFGISAWLSGGPWLVLGSLAAVGLVTGMWFLFWRRSRKHAE
jgi:hypothetical protein